MVLSEKQIDWISIKVCEFTKRWSANMPTDDSGWIQLMLEAKDLYAKSRNNELMRLWLVQTINYIDGQSGNRNISLDMLGQKDGDS